jgi:hypothetical protein
VVLLAATAREAHTLPRGLTGRVPLLCAAGTGWPARLPAAVNTARALAAAVDLVRAVARPGPSTGRAGRSTVG